MIWLFKHRSCALQSTRPWNVLGAVGDAAAGLNTCRVTANTVKKWKPLPIKDFLAEACGHFTGRRQQSVQQLGSASCRHSTGLDTESLAGSSAEKHQEWEMKSHPTSPNWNTSTQKAERDSFKNNPLKRPLQDSLCACGRWRTLTKGSCRVQQLSHKTSGTSCSAASQISCDVQTPPAHRELLRAPCALPTAPCPLQQHQLCPHWHQRGSEQQPGLGGCWSRYQGRVFVASAGLGSVNKRKEQRAERMEVRREKSLVFMNKLTWLFWPFSQQTEEPEELTQLQRGQEQLQPCEKGCLDHPWINQPAPGSAVTIQSCSPAATAFPTASCRAEPSHK